MLSVSARSILLKKGITCLLISVYIFDHVKPRFLYMTTSGGVSFSFCVKGQVDEASALQKETCGC